MITYPKSGHLPFIEQREEFAGEYLSFLDAADGVTTSRELILDPSRTEMLTPMPARGIGVGVSVAHIHEWRAAAEGADIRRPEPL